ncbi:MAG: sulfurtransferase TusA family protein [Acidimicrobiia bacterium]|nr:sulfurtransferase TusA family protein [Acidimicrobiia bacterium]
MPVPTPPAKPTKTVDTSGLACPMPIVRTRQAIDQLASGDVLEIISTDRGSLTDIPSWADTLGHQLIDSRQEGQRFVYLIKKG